MFISGGRDFTSNVVQNIDRIPKGAFIRSFMRTRASFNEWRKPINTIWAGWGENVAETRMTGSLHSGIPNKMSNSILWKMYPQRNANQGERHGRPLLNASYVWVSVLGVIAIISSGFKCQANESKGHILLDKVLDCLIAMLPQSQQNNETLS